MAIIWITPTAVTLSASGSYEEHDVSGSISASATGVIYELVVAASTFFAIRKNGSTDDRYVQFDSATALQYGAIGVDGSGIFETKQTTPTGSTLYIVGYTEDDAVFFTDAVDKSIGTTATWTDVDISSDTGGDTAIGAFFESISNGSGQDFALRKNGSTDDFYSFDRFTLWGDVVGLDGSEICEMKIVSTAQDCFLVGYFTGNCAFNTNMTDRSLGTTGSYTDLAALTDTSAVGACYKSFKSGSHNFGIRKNGSSDDRTGNVARKHSQIFVECDESRLVEMKISNVLVDVYEQGYFYDVSGGGGGDRRVSVSRS